MIAIDTLTNKVIATIPIGQAPQAVVYVPDAVSADAGTQGLEPLGLAGQTTHFTMVSPADSARPTDQVPTSVTLFDQGLVQVLEASVTGLDPKRPYLLALSDRPDGAAPLQALSSFTTNPAGAAIVNAVGPIRQIVHGDADAARRYLVIVTGSSAQPGKVVQIQAQER
jgi:DNA-binding beta-propeller fold protein YncE